MKIYTKKQIQLDNKLEIAFLKKHLSPHLCGRREETK